MLSLLLGRAGHAHSLSIDATGVHVDFGTVSPGDSAIAPSAINLVLSSPAAFSLTATAPATMATGSGLVVPIGRLSWRHHVLGGAFGAFLSGSNVILGGQPATPPEGETVSLDLRMAPEWDDAPSPEGDPYRASITFTVTAGTIDTSFAAPNPFSPDGDGVNDRTDLHWYDGAARLVDVLIYEVDGTTLVRTLTVARSYAAGDCFATWDGRTDARTVVPEGDYVYRVRVNPASPVDPGLALASGVVSVEIGTGAGTASIGGTVTSSQTGAPLEGATVELYRAGGTRVALQTTGAAGTYLFAGIGPGLYELRASAASHFPFTSQTFELADGQALAYDIRLAHNHSLVVRKRALEAQVEPGDLVGYLVEVTASGVDPVEDVRLEDQLPAGLSVVPGSARRDGSPIELAAPLAGRRALFHLGRLDPGETVSIYYEAAVAIGTRAGPLVNRARATGIAAGVPVESEPSVATVYLKDGDTGDRSLLYGRVFIDRNGDGRFGPGDKPAAGARVVIDDGTVIVCDGQGRYSAKGLRQGARAAMAVLLVIRPGAGMAVIPQGPSRLALVDLRDGVAARLDFAFGPDDEGAGGSPQADAALAVADVTVGLERGDSLILRLAGRLAGHVERDLGDGYRLKLYVDTTKAPRDELTTIRDESTFQPETGDTSTAQPAVPDKIGVRLDAPWGHALLGRASTMFEHSELLAEARLFVGLDVEAGRRRWKGRAFTGYADLMRRLDTFPLDGGIGPFQLSARPVVPMSELVEVEGRDAASGVVTSRARLRAEQFLLDYGTGLLTLTEPWAASSPTGEAFFLRVQYDYAPASEIPPQLVAGVHGEVRVTDGLTVGATAFAQDSAPEAAKILGIDASYAHPRGRLVAEAAVSDGGGALASGLEGSDPTAVRARGTLRARPGVDLFGYLSRIGGAYALRPSSRLPRMPEDLFAHFPIPRQTIIRPQVLRGLFFGQDAFPFFFQDDHDLMEMGAGATWRAREDLLVSAGSYDIDGDLDDAFLGGADREHTDYAAARWRTAPRGPAVFAAATRTVTDGASEVGLQGGTSWAADDWLLGAEALVADRDAGEEQTRTGALARALYRRHPKLQPGVLLLDLETRADDGFAIVTAERLAALGVESRLHPKILLFSYGYAGQTLSLDKDFGQAGAYVGTELSLAWLRGYTRVDALHTTTGGLELGVLGKVRLLLREVAVFVWLNHRSANDVRAAAWDDILGAAWRPARGPFDVFLKVRDRNVALPWSDLTGLTGRRTQLGALDLVLPLTPSARMGTRLAVKRAESTAGHVSTAMAGEQLAWRFRKKYEVIAGTRVATTSLGGQVLVGGTLGAGLYVDRAVRIVLGVNYARADWVFEADDSIPGAFLNVTGVYGQAGERSMVAW